MSPEVAVVWEIGHQDEGPLKMELPVMGIQEMETRVISLQAELQEEEPQAAKLLEAGFGVVGL